MAQVPPAHTYAVGDGSTTQFSFEFQYLRRDDVFVEVDGVPRSFTWVTHNTVNITPAPAAGAEVYMYRSTPAARPSYEFQLGAPFLPRYIDENFTQGLYVLHEGLDTIEFTRERMDDVEQEFDDVLLRVDAVEDRADAVEDRADAVEGRMDTLEGEFGDLETAFGLLDTGLTDRMDSVESDMAGLQDDFSDLTSDVQQFEQDVQDSVDALEARQDGLEQRTLRAPEGEIMLPFPPQAERAGRNLAFDANGNPVLVVGSDATALAAALANGTPGQGADMVAYAPGVTTRAVIEHLVQTTEGAVDEQYVADAVASGIATRAPAVHTHEQSQVNGLVAALAGKAPTTHTHGIADITGLGGAATREVTSTADSTQTGRLIKVGDYGLGAASWPARSTSLSNMPAGTRGLMESTETQAISRGLPALTPGSGNTARRWLVECQGVGPNLAHLVATETLGETGSWVGRTFKALRTGTSIGDWHETFDEGRLSAYPSLGGANITINYRHGSNHQAIIEQNCTMHAPVNMPVGAVITCTLWSPNPGPYTMTFSGQWIGEVPVVNDIGSAVSLLVVQKIGSGGMFARMVR